VAAQVTPLSIEFVQPILETDDGKVYAKHGESRRKEELQNEILGLD
jgi:hypothetical protein